MKTVNLYLARYQFEPCTKGLLLSDYKTLAYTIEPPLGYPGLLSLGIHKCVLYNSPKFGRVMIRVLDTLNPGVYAEIHSGNKVEETKDCILLGDQPSLLDNCIWNSRATCSRVLTPLYEILNNKGQVYITISNIVPDLIPAGANHA